MCGIAGIVTKHSRGYEQALKKMVDALGHRGPDAHGFDHFPNCSFGHTRLSIVDLTTGAQPMRSHDKRLGITFNGEIYGYKRLRQELDDYPFETTSDTEVILALYERYGQQFLEKLPGMFAFSLWDEKSQQLVCARDRFGEKPLYYAFGSKGEFVFASEMKTLLASGLIEPILNKDAVIHYLQRLYVPPNQTIYQNVHALPPAHVLKYSEGRLTVEPYWKLPAPQESISLTEAIEEFQRLLDDAVRRCLIADVPVGAFLSGGVDSSTIVAAASKHNQHLQTFSFGFGEAINELPFAQEVSNLYHTEHTELEDREYNIAELLWEMAHVYDEPFADSSNIPTYLISKQARQYLKVVLTGDGGDELLAGYDWCYRPIMAMKSPMVRVQLLRQMFGFAYRMRKRFFQTVPPSWKWMQKSIKIEQQFNPLNGMPCHRKQYFSSDDLNLIGLDVVHNQAAGKRDNVTESVDEAMRRDLVDYMPGDILVKIDRASMAHGLELRSPFLDVAFASFCISLPERLKISSSNDKIILRQAFGPKWPAAIRHRKKQGFGAPVSTWLKLPEVQDLTTRYLHDSKQKLFDLLSFEGSRPFASKNNYQTWELLVLALWMDRWEFRIN